MREIKFRAWDKFGKQWIEFTLADLSKNSREGEINLEGWHTTISFDCLEHWCQFTGLTDKNGKEIYEGDIVDISDGDGWNIGRGIVIFKDAKFQIEYLDGCGFDDIDGRVEEVLGNIYDNPELLAQK